MTQPDASLSPRLRAFLDLIAWSELGSDLLAASDNGYNVLVGSTAKYPIIFDSYADHPRRKIDVPRLHIYSTAAGRYQIMARTWDGLQAVHHFPDFGPASQDRAARELIKGRGALDDAEAGRVHAAITKCNREWASFPGEPYGQGANAMTALLKRYAVFFERCSQVTTA